MGRAGKKCRGKTKRRRKREEKINSGIKYSKKEPITGVKEVKTEDIKTIE